jgi:hypothetical protein
MGLNQSNIDMKMGISTFGFMGNVQPKYGHVHGDRDKPLELELGVPCVQIKKICHRSNSNLTNTHGGIMMMIIGITMIVNGISDKHLLGYHMI